VQATSALGSLAGAEVPAIGVVATPAEAAQEVTNALVAVGVPSILNFAPTVLTVPLGVLLRYVDLSIELQVMSFYQQRRQPGSPDEIPLFPPAGLTNPPRVAGSAGDGADLADAELEADLADAELEADAELDAELDEAGRDAELDRTELTGSE
jgi:redox-sensing transcriptional repressor